MSWNCQTIKPNGSWCYGNLTDDGKRCEPCASNYPPYNPNQTRTSTGGNGLLNTNLGNEYSVLGGVVAPKRSAYTITGMQNPLAQKPTRKIDTSLPSLRDNSAVSRFNDFNPYNVSPARSPEIVRNTMQMRKKGSNVVYKVNVNTFQPTGSPIIGKRFSR